MPSPEEVGRYLWDAIRDGTLLGATLVTLKRLLIGYAFGLLIGLPVGLLTARFKLLQDTIGLVALGLQTLPSVCWVPLALLWFGETEAAMFFVVVMGTLWSVIIATESGIRNVPPIYARAARTMGSSGLHTWLRVMLPAALPFIVSGMKQGWAFAWRSLMAAEIYVTILSGFGLGHLLDYGRDLNAMDQVIGIMLVLLVIGLLADKILFSPWERLLRHRWGTARNNDWISRGPPFSFSLTQPKSMAKIYNDITETIGNTPLVRLNRTAAAHGAQAEILLKLEFFNPLSSVKDRIGAAMINEGIKSGKINQDTVLIEATSGNTGIALAFVAAAKGLKLILTMPETMTMERRKLLKVLGARLVLTEGPKGMKGAIAKAEELAAKIPNSLILQQFANPSNPAVHRRTTAEEIWRDTDGKVDIVVSGIGTGGTITGVGEVLKARKPSIKIIALEPDSSPVLSGGAPGPHKLQGLGAGFVPAILNTKIYDEVMKVREEDSAPISKQVNKLDGIPIGISSGAAVWAALEVSKRPENKGKLIVAIIPSSAERYLSSWLFADVTAESDSIDDLLGAGQGVSRRSESVARRAACSGRPAAFLFAAGLELLLQLGDLGGDHDPAVWPWSGCFVEIVLVVVLGRPELGERDDLRHDRVAEALPGPGLGFFGGGLLLGRGVKDDRAVLAADIVALPVHLRRVVHDPEIIEELPQARLRRVKIDLDDLGMPRGAAAHFLVGGIARRPARIPAGDMRHPRQELIGGIGAPEASAAEHERVCLGGVGHGGKGQKGKKERKAKRKLHGTISWVLFRKATAKVAPCQNPTNPRSSSR